MTTATDRAFREAVVLGLGVTGLSCARHLAAQGRPVCVMDTRVEPPGLEALRGALPGAEVVTGGFDEGRVLAAGLVAVSPGIAADDPLLLRARAAGVDVAGDVELFARAARGPVAGITGTNGKSTVTSLVGAMLGAAGRDVAVGGNLGEPVLDLLARSPRDGFVLELSSFQLDLVETLRLDCAVILNLSADHLDRYGDLGAYAASKQRIYR
jgi:UDP-N-acetylmuramoylalanine--D-glutamate ligase